MPTPDQFNYRHLLTRTDPTCHGTNTAARITARLRTGALLAGDLEATLPVIAGTWAQVSPDPDTLSEMLAILTGFIDRAATQGVTRWDQVTSQMAREFIAPGATHGQRQLRKNTMHAAYLALGDVHLYAEPSPVRGLATPSQPKPHKAKEDQPQTRTRRYDSCGGPRPTTHDEVLVTRLATRLAANSRTINLCAATVALAGVSATTCEAPQVRWQHVDLAKDDPEASRVRLPGRPTRTRTESTIDPRTNRLDSWEYQALADWKAECSTNGAPPAKASVLYTGRQPLIGNSAQVSTDRQIRKAFDIADLTGDPTLSAGSLRLWAAARHVTSWDTLPHGANILGVEPMTLHRWMSQLRNQDQ